MLLFISIALNFLITTSIPEAAYTMFPGFDLDAWTSIPTALPSVDPLGPTRAREGPKMVPEYQEPAIEVVGSTTDPVGRIYTMSTEGTILRSTNLVKTKLQLSTKRYKSMLRTVGLSTTDRHNETMSPIKITCPEVEKPSNIGPYEVPTQRDLVFLTIRTLHRMYGNYHRKTKVFLEDINKVVRATEEVEKRCPVNRDAYKKCVKRVTTQCEWITRSLQASLEKQRLDVLAFGENANAICSIQAMKEDPVKLIRTMASEQASLDFALPGFLTLLNSCSDVCKRSLSYNGLPN